MEIPSISVIVLKGLVNCESQFYTKLEHIFLGKENPTIPTSPRNIPFIHVLAMSLGRTKILLGSLAVGDALIAVLEDTIMSYDNHCCRSTEHNLNTIIPMKTGRSTGPPSNNFRSPQIQHVKNQTDLSSPHPTPQDRQLQNSWLFYSESRSAGHTHTSALLVFFLPSRVIFYPFTKLLWATLHASCKSSNLKTSSSEMLSTLCFKEGGKQF